MAKKMQNKPTRDYYDAPSELVMCRKEEMNKVCTTYMERARMKYKPNASQKMQEGLSTNIGDSSSDSESCKGLNDDSEKSSDQEGDKSMD